MKRLFFSLCAVGLSCAAFGAGPEVNIVPKPLSVTPGAGTFTVTASTVIGVGKNAELRRSARIFAGEAFILPKKPANLLRGVLGKEDADIRMEFDDKNVVFHLKNHTLVCRLIEGNYPNYNAVIPANNPNKVLVDRTELLNGIRRVAVCSNQATNLIKFEIEPNTINLTAQDLDFSVSAQESLTCDYDIEVTLENHKTYKIDKDAQLLVKRAGMDDPIVVYADELQTDDDIQFDNRDLLFTLNEI